MGGKSRVNMAKKKGHKEREAKPDFYIPVRQKPQYEDQQKEGKKSNRRKGGKEQEGKNQVSTVQEGQQSDGVEIKDSQQPITEQQIECQ